MGANVVPLGRPAARPALTGAGEESSIIRGRPAWRAALLAALLAVSLAGCGPVGAPAAPSPTVGPVGIPAAPSPTAAGPDLIALAATVQPATVLVANLAAAPGAPEPRAGAQELVYEAAGTGVIYDPAGYIITNNHVVEGAQQIVVALPPPDRRVFTATLIGRDPQTDLAVLHIDAPNLPAVPLGASADLRAGEWVVAVGNALALPGGPTVSAGIVSALHRHALEPAAAGTAPGVPGPRLNGLIQTDAAINHGNSGGPLFNLRGEVVGINSLTTENAQTIGYAIAIDAAKPIVAQLRRRGTVTRGYLGVDTVTATPALQVLYHAARGDGLHVEWVDPDGPAAAAGLQPGDVILAIGEVPMRRPDDLGDALVQRFMPGATVAIRFARGDGEQVATATLGEKPAPYGGPA